MSERFQAYNGSEPYIFVSYSHKDSNEVYAIIDQLNREGYRIWYDQGIPQVTRYSQVIYDHIVGCGLFMVFFTANSVQSQFVLDEVHTARDENKLIFPINLDGVRLPGELKLRLSAVEQLIRENHTEYAFQVKLRESLSAFRGEAKPLSESETPSVPAAAKSSVKPAPAVAAPALKVEAPAVPKQVKVGDYIKFGRYPQSGKEPEPIEWRVLSIENDSALIISKYGLDAVKCNNSYKSITWEKCSLRHWLNNEFINTAFTAEERTKIKKVKLDNPDNYFFVSIGGQATDDEVFCLSIDEARGMFANDKERICTVTEYAKKKGAYHIGSKGWWWLRTPGYQNSDAAHIRENGLIFTNGFFVNDDRVVLRPALYIEI